MLARKTVQEQGYCLGNIRAGSLLYCKDGMHALSLAKTMMAVLFHSALAGFKV